MLRFLVLIKYNKIIETSFTKDNETIEEAKARLSAAASSKSSSLSKSDEE